MTKVTGPRVGPDFEREYPGADHRATNVSMNLFRAENLLASRLADLLREHDLTLATFNVLMILRGSDRPLCAWEISDRRLIARGTVTGLLDSLEKRGLVRRQPHPGDRRMVNVAVTPEGSALLEQLLPPFFALEAELFAGLSAREKDQLMVLLAKVQHGLTT